MAPPGSPTCGEGEHFDLGALGGLPAELSRARLPAGRHGLPRAFVARNQRLRIVAAMLRTLSRRGYAAITIADLTREAGVSRAAFYTHFQGKEDCFLATYDLGAHWLCGRVERAVESEERWSERVRAGVATMLRSLAGNPQLAHLIAVEAQQAGPVARERQRACLTRLAELLRPGRPDGSELPAELEEMLLGGALLTVTRHVESGRSERLDELTPQLVEYLLIPYLGSGETKRIASRAA